MPTPLGRFSIYTDVQVGILLLLAQELERALDQGISNGPDGPRVDGNAFNTAYGRFWLWVLGAYEVVRTMDQHSRCFAPGFAASTHLLKGDLAAIRIPFAKQERRSRKGKPIDTQASVAAVDANKRDLAFQIDGATIWMRTLTSAFEKHFGRVDDKDVLLDMRS